MHDVLEDRHVREKVEALEDDPDVAAQGVDVDAWARGAIAVNADLAGIDLLKPIYAAQKGGFAAARGSDQADHLMLLDLEGEARQHLVRAEALVDIADLDERHDGWRVVRLRRRACAAGSVR
jgi:hypothetical protein